MFGGAVTSDSGTINAGLVGATDPQRRGAFLAVHAMAGFGAAAVSPMLFGFVLDAAGGAHHGTAWIAAFAVQAVIGMLWPLAYLARLRHRARGLV